MYVYQDLTKSNNMSEAVKLTLTRSQNKVTRQVKLITEQHVMLVSAPSPDRNVCRCCRSSIADTELLLRSDKPSGVEGFPMREWSIKIFLVNPAGEDVTANIFNKATYELHPSFPQPTHGKCPILQIGLRRASINATFKT